MTVAIEMAAVREAENGTTGQPTIVCCGTAAPLQLRK